MEQIHATVQVVAKFQFAEAVVDQVLLIQIAPFVQKASSSAESESRSALPVV
mgnify:FL=1